MDESEQRNKMTDNLQVYRRKLHTMRLRLKKIGIMIVSGILACSAPAAVFGGEIVEQVQDVITEETIDSLLEDPDKVVDVILYVKEFVDQQDITDEDIRNAIDMAAEHFQIGLSDSDRDAILKIVKKFKDMDVDREELKKDVEKVYDAMDFFGVDAGDIKSDKLNVWN